MDNQANANATLADMVRQALAEIKEAEREVASRSAVGLDMEPERIPPVQSLLTYDFKGGFEHESTYNPERWADRSRPRPHTSARFEGLTAHDTARVLRREIPGSTPLLIIAQELRLAGWNIRPFVHTGEPHPTELIAFRREDGEDVRLHVWRSRKMTSVYKTGTVWNTYVADPERTYIE